MRTKITASWIVGHDKGRHTLIRDGEVDMIYRAQIAARRRQIDDNVLDGKQGIPGHSAP